MRDPLGFLQLLYGLGYWFYANGRYLYQRMRSRGYLPIEAVVQSIIEDREGPMTSVEVLYEIGLGDKFYPGSVERVFAFGFGAERFKRQYPLRRRILVLHDPANPARSFVSPDPRLNTTIGADDSDRQGDEVEDEVNQA